MKFLLWQFAPYAAMAMLVGAVLGSLWSRSTYRLLRRHSERLERSMHGAHATISRLSEQRAKDETLLSDATGLAGRLTELHAALALVEADVCANQIGREEAERARNEAVANSLRDRSDAARVRQVDFDVARLRSQLAELRVTHQSLQHETRQSVAEAEAQVASVQGTLVRLQSVHDSSVVRHQTELSRLKMLVEEVTVDRRRIAAELRRAEARARAAERAIDTLSQSGVAEAIRASSLNVIDLRTSPSDLSEELVVADVTQLEEALDA